MLSRLLRDANLLFEVPLGLENSETIRRIDYKTLKTSVHWDDYDEVIEHWSEPLHLDRILKDVTLHETPNS